MFLFWAALGSLVSSVLIVAYSAGRVCDARESLERCNRDSERAERRWIETWQQEHDRRVKAECETRVLKDKLRELSAPMKS